MTIFNAVPFTLTNGTTADATQVMANLNQIINDGNTNAAHNGANSDITSLAGLTTSLSQAQGGTGTTTGLNLIPWAAAAGAADAITATYSPAIATLSDGLCLGFRATAANATATPTFAPNGLTAQTITKSGGVALLPNDIPGNLAECVVRYNLANTRWELLNPATRRSFVVFGTGGNNVPAGSAQFFNTSGTVSNTQPQVLTPIGFSGIIRNMYVQASAAPGVGQNYTLVFQYAGLDTSLSVTISGNVSSGADTNQAHAVTVAAGNSMDIRIGTSGGAQTAFFQVMVEIDVIG